MGRTGDDRHSGTALFDALTDDDRELIVKRLIQTRIIHVHHAFPFRCLRNDVL
jgi:hypothetical protein